MQDALPNQNQEKQNLGSTAYLNKNCWLVRNLNYGPYGHCKYCEFHFRECVFLQYQVISLILIILSFSIFILVDKKLTLIPVITIFTIVIVYGYSFNKNMEKITKSNYSLKQSQQALKELTEKLEQKVDQQTKDIKIKNQNLEELINLKTDFLRVVNHQLNTPISIINGAMSMMDEKIWDTQKSLNIIKSGFLRLTQTVRDFWDAYELEGENLKIYPQNLDITDIVNRVVSEKQKLPLAIQRRLQISINKPSFAIPIVWCDPRKIVHVFSNLLDNAIYYTEKGSVTLSFGLKPNFLEVSIADTGAGISEEDRQIIFKKFARGQSASLLRPDGSGLGLYIAQKIIASHGGEITFDSPGIGKGSTFRFTIPIYTNQPITQEANQQVEKHDKIVMFRHNRLT